jgi:hypothetical protein
VPAHPHHRLVRGVEVFILPVQGRGVAGGPDKAGILGIGGLGGRQIKRLQGHPVGGGLAGVAPGFGEGTAQQIAAAGDQAEPDALGLRGIHGRRRGAQGQQQPAQEKEPGSAVLGNGLPILIQFSVFGFLFLAKIVYK